MAEVSGLPGAPVRAVEVPGQALPSVVQQAFRDGIVTGSPPVYEFTMDDAIAQVPDPVQFRDGFRQDIVHAVIVGPVGQLTASGVLQWNAGTPAQQAVEDGLLQAIGSQPYPRATLTCSSARSSRRSRPPPPGSRRCPPPPGTPGWPPTWPR